MKSKLIAIILPIVILLAVHYVLGTDYLKEQKEQEELTAQISDVSQTLAETPRPTQDAELRLTTAQASLATEQDKFSRMTGTEIIDAILKLAADSRVKAIPIVTQAWSPEEIGDHAYHVFRLNVAVEGSFSQLVGFVNQLEYGEFKTLIVENLSVTRASEQSEEGVAEATIPVTASLDLAIYTPSPTSD